MDSTLKATKAPTSVTLSGKTFSKELVVRILGYLGQEELYTMSKVNSQFSNLVEETSLKASSNDGRTHLPTTAASLPALSTVIESIPFPPPAAIQTTLPCVVTTVAPNVKISLPVESKVIMPILPEAMPMIVTVPDVVPVPAKATPVQSGQGTDGKEKKSEVVQINQVLPGYAPSYAHDYVPPEVNYNTVTTFANTISFNVSRYPNLTDIMDSKTYNQKKQELERAGSKEKEEPKMPPHTTQHNAWDLQYIPAEYGRDDYGKHSVTVSAAKNIAIVKPEVLSSGRLLTHMSPVTDTSQAASCSVTQSGASSVHSSRRASVDGGDK